MTIDSRGGVAVVVGMLAVSRKDQKNRTMRQLAAVAGR